MGVLDRAVAWWHADKYSGSGAWLDESGNGHNAALGAGAAAPVWVPYNGRVGLFCGTNGSIPAYFTFTNGDGIECLNGHEGIVDLSAPWSEIASDQYLYEIGDTVNGRPSACLMLKNTGILAYYHWIAGPTYEIKESTAALPWSGNWNDWDRKLVRVTRDDVSGDIDFYYKDPADAGWTQLGTTVSGTAGAATDKGNAFALGCQRSNTNFYQGIIHNVKVYDNDTGGTLQLHLDFTTLTPGATSLTDFSANAYTCSIYRTAANLAEPLVVNRNMWYFSGAQYFEVTDHADLDVTAAQDLSVYAIYRKITDLTATAVPFDKGGAAGGAVTGWGVYFSNSDAPTARVDAGSAYIDAGAAVSDSLEYGVGMVVDQTSGLTIEVFQNGVAGGSPAVITAQDLSNALPLRFGVNADATTWYWKGALIGLAVFKEALSDADMMQLHYELRARQVAQNVQSNILDEAVAWFHADLYTDYDAFWVDQSGNNHHAELKGGGNGPLFLKYDADDGQYIHPGGAGPGYSAAATGSAVYCRETSAGPGTLMDCDDVEIQALIHLRRMKVSGNQTGFICDRFVNVGYSSDVYQSHFYVRYNSSTGILAGPVFCWSTLDWPGNTNVCVSGDAGIEDRFSEGEKFWIRVTLDVDNGAAGHDVKFYTAPDSNGEPGSWTQLGSTLNSGAGTTSVRSPLAGQTMTWRIGCHPFTTWTPNDDIAMYKFRAWNGFQGSGTQIFDIDFTDNTDIIPGVASFTEDGPQARTIDINRGHTGADIGAEALVVTRAMFKVHHDDYFEIPAFDALDIGSGDDFTVYILGRTSSNNDIAAMILDKGANSGGTGWGLRYSTAENLESLLDETSVYSDTGPTVADSLEHGVGFRIQGTSLVNILDGVPEGSPVTTTNQDYSNTNSLRIGADAASLQNYYDGAIIAVAIFDRALTDAELLTLHNTLDDLAYVAEAGTNVDLVRALEQDAMQFGSLGMDAMLAGSQARKWR